jgi:hypothetical protein
MGTYYLNSVFLSTSHIRLAQALRQLSRRAYVLPEKGLTVTVFDEECDEKLNDSVTDDFARRMTKLLVCTSVSVMVAFEHDLLMHVHSCGKLVGLFVVASDTSYISERYRNGFGGISSISGVMDRDIGIDRLRQALECKFDTGEKRHRAILNSLSIPGDYVGVRFRDLNASYGECLSREQVCFLSANDVQHFQIDS